MKNKTLIEQLEEFNAVDWCSSEEHKRYEQLWRGIKESSVSYSEDLVVDKYFNIHTKDISLNNSVFSTTNKENCIFDIVVSDKIINIFKFMIKAYELDSKIYEKNILERYKFANDIDVYGAVVYNKLVVRYLFDKRIVNRFQELIKQHKIHKYANPVIDLYTFGLINKQSILDILKNKNTSDDQYLFSKRLNKNKSLIDQLNIIDGVSASTHNSIIKQFSKKSKEELQTLYKIASENNDSIWVPFIQASDTKYVIYYYMCKQQNLGIVVCNEMFNILISPDCHIECCGHFINKENLPSINLTEQYIENLVQKYMEEYNKRQAYLNNL